MIIPLAVFLITGLLFGRIPKKIAGILGTAGIAVVAVLSYITAYKYFFAVGKTEGIYQAITVHKHIWMRFTETLNFDMGILLDPISVMMLVVVSTISLMVHIYSMGYMSDDKGYAKFFTFLSLFTFSMLGLVVATNLFQIYFFWELVGVSSFLLIGFYYDKVSAVKAAKKAFIVTRFADLGFLIGILIMSYYAGTFDFLTLVNPEGAVIANQGSTMFMGLSVFTWAVGLIFIGGAGKSAMFPLHIWLPDAMEGPTPVSALIHAATMVVAGVFLVARLFPLYYFLDNGVMLHVIAYVGGFTSLFAAIIAITQTDIKRVLAFSTLSQLGYMMLALGVSHYEGHEGLGYMAAMFHLFTHAMFKALLFLGAGSVIHAVHSNYLKDMGGLRKYLKVTHITFLIACLAISGIPPFAGFFSKDEILLAAFHSDKLLWFVEYVVAGITAFYMFRIYFGIFWGEEKEYEHAPHESPFTMTFPLMFLALASITVGWIPFSEFISADGKGFEGGISHIDWSMAIPSILIGVVGIVVAYVLYKKKNEKPAKLAKSFGVLYTAAKDKFYFDEIYLWITKNIMFGIFASGAAWIDKNIVNGALDGSAWLTNKISDKIKELQSGQLQDYAFYMVSGVVTFVLVFLYWM